MWDRSRAEVSLPVVNEGHCRGSHPSNHGNHTPHDRCLILIRPFQIGRVFCPSCHPDPGSYSAWGHPGSPGKQLRPRRSGAAALIKSPVSPEHSVLPSLGVKEVSQESFYKKDLRHFCSTAGSKWGSVGKYAWHTVDTQLIPLDKFI